MTPRWLRILVPVAILAAGGVATGALVATSPDAPVERPTVQPPLVRVVPVALQDVRHRVVAHGTVAPRTESELVPQVSGPIAWVSPAFVSGGFFQEGEPLVRIDAGDYETALERARAGVARAASEASRARSDLARRRSLAEQDYASPAHVEEAEMAAGVAEAALRQARAELEQAERDLARTELRAPFEGRVREIRADVGEFVSRGSPVATLYATDAVDVRLPLADEELAFLEIPLWYRDEIPPDERPRVVLRARFAGVTQEWEGEVVRTEGEIDPQSRMVHVVARVREPYATAREGKRPPLAVGLFVEAEILGRTSEGVYVLPRAALREDGRLRVADADDRLRLRETQVVRRRRDEVVVRASLEPGDRVVLSPLAEPVEGMALRTLAPESAVALEEEA